MNDNNRYRELRRKIADSGRSSLTTAEKIEFEQVSPINRTDPKEGSYEAVEATLEEMQVDIGQIKEAVAKLAQLARKSKKTDL